MLSSQKERETRAIFLADSTANVVWVMLLIGLQSFAMVMARRLGAGAFLLSAGSALMYLPGMLTGSLPLLCRRFPLGGVMIALRVIAGCGTLLCLCWPSLYGLAFGFAIMTIAGGWVEACYPVFVRSVYPAATHSRVMGTIFTARALAAFLWVLLLGWLISNDSPVQSIRVLGGVGVLGIVSAMLHWRFRHVREEHAEEHAAAQPDARPVTPPLANREFIYYLISLTVFGAGIMFSLVATPFMQVNAFRLSNSQVGMLVAVGMLSQMLAYIYFSRFGVARANNRLLAIPYALLAAPITVSAVLLACHLYPPFHVLPFGLLLAANVVGGIGTGLQAMYFYLVVNALAGSSSALGYQTTQQTVVGLRGVIMPFVAGIVYQHFGLLTCVVISSALILGGGVLAFFLSTHRLPVRVPQPELVES